jgi:hypothetical protein
VRPLVHLRVDTFTLQAWTGGRPPSGRPTAQRKMHTARPLIEPVNARTIRAVTSRVRQESDSFPPLFLASPISLATSSNRSKSISLAAARSMKRYLKPLAAFWSSWRATAAIGIVRPSQATSQTISTACSIVQLFGLFKDCASDKFGTVFGLAVIGPEHRTAAVVVRVSNGIAGDEPFLVAKPIPLPELLSTIERTRYG